MQQVLARRDDNWKKLQQYILDEQERAELRGPGGALVWGEKRDYTWYVRDGYFVAGILGGGLLHEFGDVLQKPQEMWWIVAAVGVLTAGGMWLYDKILKPAGEPFQTPA